MKTKDYIFINQNYLEKLTISFSGICKKTHPISLVVKVKFSNHAKCCAKKHLEGVGNPHLLPIDDQIITHSEISTHECHNLCLLFLSYFFYRTCRKTPSSSGGCSSHITSTSWLTHSKASHLNAGWNVTLLMKLFMKYQIPCPQGQRAQGTPSWAHGTQTCGIIFKV